MDIASQKGLFTSILLHSACFLCLIIPNFLGSCAHKETKKHVLTLEASPTITTANSKQAQPFPIAQIKAPKPKSQASLPKEKLQPIAQKPEVSKISYQDFIKKQGKPKPPQPKQIASEPIISPKINTQQVRQSLESILSQTNDLHFDELSAYNTFVRSKIDMHWTQPNNFLDYNNSTIVNFDIDAKGKILAVRIVKSSGSISFDESIKKAFDKTVTFGSTPNGKARTLEMTFSKK